VNLKNEPTSSTTYAGREGNSTREGGGQGRDGGGLTRTDETRKWNEGPSEKVR
jgi:hypothetical protein